MNVIIKSEKKKKKRTRKWERLRPLSGIARVCLGQDQREPERGLLLLVNRMAPLPSSTSPPLLPLYFPSGGGIIASMT
jgi:hypothetical protein